VIIGETLGRTLIALTHTLVIILGSAPLFGVMLGQPAGPIPGQPLAAAAGSL
jgi:hypothetical protein